jgi:hypothetical protein
MLILGYYFGQKVDDRLRPNKRLQLTAFGARDRIFFDSWHQFDRVPDREGGATRAQPTSNAAQQGALADAALRPQDRAHFDGRFRLDCHLCLWVRRS